MGCTSGKQQMSEASRQFHTMITAKPNFFKFGYKSDNIKTLAKSIASPVFGGSVFLPVAKKGHKRSKKYAEGKDLGQNLYLSLHLLLYTGFFRLLPSRDFPYELGVGFALELLLSVIPMLFCQITNNAEIIENYLIRS